MKENPLPARPIGHKIEVSGKKVCDVNNQEISPLESIGRRIRVFVKLVICMGQQIKIEKRRPVSPPVLAEEGLSKYLDYWKS